MEQIVSSSWWSSAVRGFLGFGMHVRWCPSFHSNPPHRTTSIYHVVSFLLICLTWDMRTAIARVLPCLGRFVVGVRFADGNTASRVVRVGLYRFTGRRVATQSPSSQPRVAQPSVPTILTSFQRLRHEYPVDALTVRHTACLIAHAGGIDSACTACFGRLGLV